MTSLPVTDGRPPEIVADVERGLASYGLGAFLEAHEHFERAWIATSEPRSLELHALAQLAAAVHKHVAQHRAEAASAIAGRARAKFERIPVSDFGLDLVRLRASLDAWVVGEFREAPPLARLP